MSSGNNPIDDLIEIIIELFLTLLGKLFFFFVEHTPFCSYGNFIHYSFSFVSFFFIALFYFRLSLKSYWGNQRWDSWYFSGIFFGCFYIFLGVYIFLLFPVYYFTFFLYLWNHPEVCEAASYSLNKMFLFAFLTTGTNMLNCLSWYTFFIKSDFISEIFLVLLILCRDFFGHFAYFFYWSPLLHPSRRNIKTYKLWMPMPPKKTAPPKNQFEEITSFGSAAESSSAFWPEPIEPIESDYYLSMLDRWFEEPAPPKNQFEEITSFGSAAESSSVYWSDDISCALKESDYIYIDFDYDPDGPEGDWGATYAHGHYRIPKNSPLVLKQQVISELCEAWLHNFKEASNVIFLSRYKKFEWDGRELVHDTFDDFIRALPSGSIALKDNSYTWKLPDGTITKNQSPLLAINCTLFYKHVKDSTALRLDCIKDFQKVLGLRELKGDTNVANYKEAFEVSLKSYDTKSEFLYNTSFKALAKALKEVLYKK
jgi:hypothetical protein